MDNDLENEKKKDPRPQDISSRDCTNFSFIEILTIPTRKACSFQEQPVLVKATSTAKVLKELFLPLLVSHPNIQLVDLGL